MAKPIQGARVGCVRVGGEDLFVVSLPPERRRPVEELTAAEREVLELLWEGCSTTRIAALRGSSYRTVANQLASIYAKAGVTTRAELVARLAGSAPPGPRA